MIELARRAYPELKFAVGSMTALSIRDDELGGILAYYSTHHTPPDQLPVAYAEFNRTLSPGGLPEGVGHVATDEQLCLPPAEAYGGHPVSYESHLLPAERIAELLSRAGFLITARLIQEHAGGSERAFATFLARKPERPSVAPFWLSMALYGDNGIPTAYFDAMSGMVEAIHSDPRWCDWWAQAVQPALVIDINCTARSGRSRVNDRKGQTWASFRLDESRFRGWGAGGLAQLACTDMEIVFTRVSAALDLPLPAEVPRPANAVPPTAERVAARERLAELRRRHRP
ncbi:class I SAM-dependent methyltransferase [Streptomyces graminilatus]|uniref:class I SAM-dependent methyltransferase n=1 Tax=Streptomyces graminilatus TaxID=1464070 RepID=UPI003BB16E37